MNRFSAILLASFLIASPMAAFTVDVPGPNLSFPTPEPKPEPEPSRACINPTALGTETCPATE